MTNTNLVTIAVITDTHEHLKSILKIFFRIAKVQEGKTAQEVTVPVEKANLLIKFIDKFNRQDIMVIEVMNPDVD